MTLGLKTLKDEGTLNSNKVDVATFWNNVGAYKSMQEAKMWFQIFRPHMANNGLSSYGYGLVNSNWRCKDSEIWIKIREVIKTLR